MQLQYENVLEVRRLILRLDDFISWASVSAQDSRLPVSTTPVAAEKEVCVSLYSFDGSLSQSNSTMLTHAIYRKYLVQKFPE